MIETTITKDSPNIDQQGQHPKLARKPAREKYPQQSVEVPESPSLSAEELEKAPPRHTVHSANVVSLLSSTSKLYDVTPKSQLQDSRLAYSPTDGVKKRSHFVASKSNTFIDATSSAGVGSPFLKCFNQKPQDLPPKLPLILSSPVNVSKEDGALEGPPAASPPGSSNPAESRMLGVFVVHPGRKI
ncbi:MAG: hypothetical protein ASARMPRED_003301 [Alectoria sarmentosa]|nr:MAG: hypothetical protein ASARMPRED_003301 [Alectoria sarmentosa]